MNGLVRDDVYEGSQFISSKSNGHKAVPKIDIDMKVATHVLLRELLLGPSSKNVVCSPLSLEFVLHKVAASSKGETLSQILQFIGLKDRTLLDPKEALNLKSCAIMRVASSYSSKESPKEKQLNDEKEPELSFANGVWVNKWYELKPSFIMLMNNIYNARAEAADFENRPGQVVEEINSWVADNTKGLITKILKPDDVHGFTVMVFVNALYFRGLWDYGSQLDTEMTKEGDFHLLDGSKILVPFMTRMSPYYLFRAFNDFKVLQLNYQRGNDKQRHFCMQILLPNAKDGLQNLVDKCISDPGFLHQDFGLKYERLSRLQIPKFKIMYEVKNVPGMMQDLGLTRPFMDDCPDITEMVYVHPPTRIKVSRILHKAVIIVDEGGTEAAAVTEESDEDMGYSLDSEPPSPPKVEFVAEHPFIFMIKEINTGAIFFFGAVFNPLKED